MTHIALNDELYKTIHSIFLESHEIDEKGALIEASLMIALSKRDKYLNECGEFERKHQMSFAELQKKVRAEKEKEDFQTEDDLNDWEFAIYSLGWWDNKVKELNRVL